MSFYRHKIFDHYKNPRNLGKIVNADCISHVDNPLCGDTIDLYLTISDNKIHDLKFKAEGCAISVATMSLLSENTKGLEIPQVLAFNEKSILKIVGIPLGFTRLKCALLGLQALKACLQQLGYN